MKDPREVRVAVATADPDAGEVLRRSLSDLGYVVVGSAAERASLPDLVRELRPDVLILDSQLAHVDGSPTVNRLAESGPTPVVLVRYGRRSDTVSEPSSIEIAPTVAGPPTARELDQAIVVALTRSSDRRRMRLMSQTLDTAVTELEGWKRRCEFFTTASNQVAYQYDLETGEMSWGGGLERLLGYARPELQGGLRQWEGLIDPRDRDEALRRLTAQTVGNWSCDAEYRFPHKDGHLIWILDRRCSLGEVGARTRTIAGVIQDVSERRWAEEFAQIQRGLAIELGHDNDLRTALRRVLKATLSLEGIDCGGVYVADPTTGALTLVCHSGVSADFATTVGRYAPDSPIASLIARGEAVYSDSEAITGALHLPEEEGLRALAALPVIHDGAVVAVVNVASRRLKEIPAWVRRGLEATTAQIGGALARLRAQAALKDSGEQLAVLGDEARAAEKRALDIVDFLPDATFVIDRDKRVIAWNPAVEEMTGTRKVDIIGQGDYAYAIPFYGERRPILIDLIGLDEPTLESRYDYVKRHGRSLYAEVYVPSLFGGRGAYVWVAASPLLDRDGNRIGAIESVRDVTERRAAEAALRRAEEKYHSIFENALEGIFRTSPEGRFITANPALARIVGYESEDEMIAAVTDIGEQIYSDLETRRQVVERVAREGKVEGLEVQMRRRDGTPIWALLNARANRDEKGKTQHFDGFLVDITERKHAEDRLRESEERFRSTFEQAAVGIAHLAPEGGFLRINRRFCDIVGYTREDLLALTFQEITHPEDLETDVALAGEVLDGTRANYSIEKRYLRKDRSVVWVELTVALVRSATGSPEYFISVIQDISKRKLAEEALRASEEKFRTVVEELSEGFSLADEDGSVIEWNRAMERITAIPREEAVGQPYWEVERDVAGPEGAVGGRHTEEIVLAAVKRGAPPPGGREFEIRSRDGQTRSIQQSMFLIKTERGHRLGAVTRDVSESRRAQAQLERRADFDALVTRLLARFASCAASEVDEHISDSLREICGFIGAESGWVALLCQDGASWTITHEWSAPGIARLSDRYEEQRLGTLPWVEAQLVAGRAVRFSSIDDLPAGAVAERRVYGADAVRSALQLPLRGRGGAYRGAIGVKSHSVNRDWGEDDIGCLSVVADAIANALDRKTAEDALRMSEERFRTIVQQARDVVTVLDENGKLVYESPATESVLGYAPGSLVGRDLLTLVHPEDADRARRELERTYEGTNPGVPTQFRFRHADGRWVHVETLGRNLLRNPAVRGVVLTTRDITLRKRTEEALVDSERRLRLVLDNTWEVLVLWTVEGPGLFRVATVNRAYTELLQRSGMGIDAESLVGKTFEEVFEGIGGLDHDVVEADRRRFVSAVETRQPMTYEMAMDLPVGTFVFEMTICPVLDEDGACRHLLRASRDVTERKKALEELRRSEENFSEAFRSGPVPTAISRAADGTILDINGAFEEMTGFGRDEFVGRSALEIGLWADPRDRERVVASLAAGGSVRDELVGIRKKTGETITVRYSAVGVMRGGVQCLLSVFVDVTERVRAEEALRTEKAFTDALIESLPGTFFAFEGGERLVRWNTEYERVSGWSAAELEGMGPLAFIEESERPAAAEKVREVFESGAVTMETRIVTKDGREIPFSFSGAGVEIGGQSYLVGVGLDITERKRSEERQARLQEEVMAAATEWTETFDAVESPLVVTDSDGTIRRLNVAARTLAGSSRWEDLIGHRLADLAEGEPWRTAARLVDQATREGGAKCQDVRDDTGHHAWALEAARVGVVPARVITVIRDITAFLELQESLARKETMSAMGTLVGGVAHEVRNPLFGISGLLDALDAKFREDARLEEYFKALRRETDRLTTLMKALLEFGRPVSEERTRLPLAVVAREATQLCRKEAATRGINVAVEVPDTLPLVPMDRMRMVEVLRNLVENAVQHSPDGGRVTLTARSLDPERPGWLEVAVKDAGPGFSEADRTRVFEPFFSRRTGGTGLGLSIVQRVVAAHGGEVEVGNQSGGGGIVTMQLPM